MVVERFSQVISQLFQQVYLVASRSSYILAARCPVHLLFLFICTLSDSMQLAIIAPCALCLPTLLTHCTGTALSGFVLCFVSLTV